MQTSLKLDVYAGENLTGTLARSQIEEESYLFGYADGSGDQDAVSLTMPVVRDQYDSMNGLLPIFEMNLPEGALLEKLRNQFAKIIPQFDSLDLLAIVGQSQIGRLRYATSGTAPAAIPDQNLSQLLAYAGAEDLFADLLRQYAEHSGISGLQPKVLVREAQSPLPRLSHRAATHIVKSFDPREFPELAANEFFCRPVLRNRQRRRSSEEFRGSVRASRSRGSPRARLRPCMHDPVPGSRRSGSDARGFQVLPRPQAANGICAFFLQSRCR